MNTNFRICVHPSIHQNLMLQSYKQKIVSIEQEQKQLCNKFGVEFHRLNFELKFGASDNFFSGKMPRNGLRHPAEGNTCGWYFWAGEEFSEDTDFFKPLHLFHLIDRSSDLLKYLALPAGWRFLVAENYEDVWFDEKLLKI